MESNIELEERYNKLLDETMALKAKYDNILATESGHENNTENVWQSGYAAGHDAGRKVMQSQYLKEYLMYEEGKRRLLGDGKPSEWTVEKIKGFNHVKLAEMLKGQHEVIIWLDGVVYALQEGCQNWEADYAALRAKCERYEQALKVAKIALETCYDVMQFPANGETRQDDAINKITEALEQEGEKEPAIQSYKDDGLLFAEWLYKNRWFHFENGKWQYTFEQGTRISDKEYQKKYVKATSELYAIYQKETGKAGEKEPVAQQGENKTPEWIEWLSNNSHNVPDLTACTQEEKQTLVNTLFQSAGIQFLKMFYAVGLENFMESGVINEATGDLFRLRFELMQKGAKDEAGKDGNNG